MATSSKYFLINALAVIAGILSAVLCFSILFLLCVYLGLIGWTEIPIRLLEITTPISLVVVGIISALAGGFVTMHISKGKDWLLIIITGSLLVGIFLPANSFFNGEITVLLFLLLPCTLAGGWLKRNSDQYL